VPVTAMALAGNDASVIEYGDVLGHGLRDTLKWPVISDTERAWPSERISTICRRVDLKRRDAAPRIPRSRTLVASCDCSARLFAYREVS
jgi:hypothetical protein